MDHFQPETPRGKTLTRQQKAAVIVRLLLGEGVELDLAGLPPPLQEDLILQLAGMRSVDHTTLAEVAAEFAEAVDSIGLTFRHGIAGALGTLGRAIPPHTADRLRRQLGPDAMGDPWERIAELGLEALIPVIEAESVEVGAVILAKLKVSRAAEVLSRLPGPRARRIAYAMSQTEGVAPELVHAIGAAILEQIDTRPAPVFADGPVKRVGAILNSSPGAIREDVLEGLDEADRAFADEVRKAIFTFGNIPERLDPRDVAKVVKAVDQLALMTALVAATQAGQTEPVEFIFANMSQRLAAQLREEMETLGRVREKDGDAAMSTVVAAIREMERSGEIILIASDEE